MAWFKRKSRQISDDRSNLIPDEATMAIVPFVISFIKNNLMLTTIVTAGAVSLKDYATKDGIDFLIYLKQESGKSEDFQSKITECVINQKSIKFTPLASCLEYPINKTDTTATAANNQEVSTKVSN